MGRREGRCVKKLISLLNRIAEDAPLNLRRPIVVSLLHLTLTGSLTAESDIADVRQREIRGKL
jgi:hypothetical protein